MESNTEVAKPPVFNEEVEKVGRFIRVCKLYLKIKMRRILVKEKI